MHTERDGGDHHKHQSRNRIQKETETDHEFIVELKPVLIEHDVLQTVGAGNEVGASTEEIGKRSVIGKHKSGAHATHAEPAGELVAHFGAEQSKDQKHGQGIASISKGIVGAIGL